MIWCYVETIVLASSIISLSRYLIVECITCWAYIGFHWIQVGPVYRLLWSAIERVTWRFEFCQPSYWRGHLSYLAEWYCSQCKILQAEFPFCSPVHYCTTNIHITAWQIYICLISIWIFLSFSCSLMFFITICCHLGMFQGLLVMVWGFCT